MYKFLTYKWYTYFSALIIVANTVVLAIEHHNEDLFERNYMTYCAAAGGCNQSDTDRLSMDTRLKDALGTPHLAIRN
jgi:hypothetical protein